MDQVGRWVPGYAPLDEGYWEALLRAGDGAPASGLASGLDAEQHYLGDAHEPETGDVSAPAPVVDWWDEAAKVMEQDGLLRLPVVGCNRGGVLVCWNDLRGFVPASHLVRGFPAHASEAERQEELRRLIGIRLSLRILELDREEGRFVLSERAASLDEDHRQRALEDLSPGDVCTGRVTNLCSFGAFVDLNGVEGLVHISELSWGRVDRPEDVLELGQPIDVTVLSVDRARGRVGLSVKRLRPDPWASVHEQYHPGQVLTGCVTRVVGFGAFVQVEDGLEGLVHVSEMEDGAVTHPRDVVREGEQVRVRVLNVDGQQRRLGLSMRQVGQASADEGFLNNDARRGPGSAGFTNRIEGEL